MNPNLKALQSFLESMPRINLAEGRIAVVNKFELKEGETRQNPDWDKAQYEFVLKEIERQRESGVGGKE